VTATFSEAMQASTVTPATVTLVAPGGGAVAASVTYNETSRVATVDPTADLAPSTTYTATVKGGSSGVKDTAGNALASDYVWSFTTGATSNTSPVATISSPQSSFKFKVGDLITYSGSATDAEDGTVPPERLAWDITISHCPGGTCHTHFFTSGSGAGGSFTVPDHGDDSYFVITLRATDSAGSTGTSSVTIQPHAVQITLQTAPAGLQVVYNGTTATAPFTYSTIAGGTRTIGTPSPQNGLSFESWSDGGAQQHNVTMGTANVTYTATFADTTPPTVTGVTPQGGATGVTAGTNVTATFSEAMQASTVTAATVTLAAQGGGPVAASVTYNATSRVATLDPTADLAPSTTYTATVKGGSSGVKDTAGNALAADYIWSFTTATAADTTPPTVTGVTPSAGATGVAVGTNVTATFSEAMQASTVTSATVTLAAPGGGAIAASVSYNATSRTATLDPTADLAASTKYTATVKGGSSGVKDTAGNALAADYVWSFTTAAADPTPPTPGTTVQYL
ncbi:MAG: Ig-like domain-containing protein, partial [Actinobacteria bacterium]|nr:Ig-like domain-containing protein [Actinomycetota bacterium]